MERISQESFNQVLFAERLHRGIKRFLKAIRTEHLLTQRLQEATKEKELASEFIGTNLIPLSDEELSTLKLNFPDVEKFIDTVLESRKVSENSGVSN
jgi:hypothetical protein